MRKSRLDTLLAERGLFASRSRAAAAVMAGDVRISGDGGAPKPGQLVADDVELEVAEAERFVSRGAIKLSNALDAFAIDVAGRAGLDVGAATGGFTDCLLQRGCARVTTLDVAYGELALSLREDPRVSVIERTNARSVTPSDLPWRPDMIVCDVSFIGLGKVLPAVLDCAAERFDCLALVKPQFEVGRELVGRGGVVREPADRRAALVTVAERARELLGVSVLGFASSGLPGPAGNRESFVWLAEPGRARARADLEQAACEVEP